MQEMIEKVIVLYNFLENINVLRNTAKVLHIPRKKFLFNIIFSGELRKD